MDRLQVNTNRCALQTLERGVGDDMWELAESLVNHCCARILRLLLICELGVSDIFQIVGALIICRLRI